MRSPAGPAATGALLSLLLPVIVAGKVVGPPDLERPVVWLGLHLLGWAAFAAVLLGHRRDPADRLELTDEAERINRGIADCVARSELYRAALAHRPGSPTIEELVLALRQAGPSPPGPLPPGQYDGRLITKGKGRARWTKAPWPPGPEQRR